MVQLPVPVLEKIVSAIGTNEFGASLLGLAREFVVSDQCTVFAFSDSGRAPLAVVAEGESKAETKRARNLALEYISGEFKHDPMFQLAKDVDGSTTRVLRLSSSDFPSPAYRRQFYEGPGLASEIAIIGRYQGLRLYASFYRNIEKPAFSDEDVTIFQELGPLILRFVGKHAEMERYVRHKSSPGTQMSNERREQMLYHLRTIFLSDCDELTEREAAVCARIAVGYSVSAIALTLDIAPSTVATFRKRAYAKLGISSQNELFAHYFETVRQLQLS